MRAGSGEVFVAPLRRKIHKPLLVTQADIGIVSLPGEPEVFREAADFHTDLSKSSYCAKQMVSTSGYASTSLGWRPVWMHSDEK
jgi:hypothetical protein